MAKQRAVSTSFRLTPEARDLIDAIAKRRGVSQASVIEWVMREKAEELGIRHGDPTEAEPPLDASPAKPMGS